VGQVVVEALLLAVQVVVDLEQILLVAMDQQILVVEVAVLDQLEIIMQVVLAVLALQLFLCQHLYTQVHIQALT